jgi:hypothetical protein
LASISLVRIVMTSIARSSRIQEIDVIRKSQTKVISKLQAFSDEKEVAFLAAKSIYEVAYAEYNRDYQELMAEDSIITPGRACLTSMVRLWMYAGISPEKYILSSDASSTC